MINFITKNLKVFSSTSNTINKKLNPNYINPWAYHLASFLIIASLANGVLRDTGSNVMQSPIIWIHLLSWFTWIMLLHYAIWMILYHIFQKRMLLSFIVSMYFLTAFHWFDMFHYYFFDTHISLLSIDIAFRALIGNELHLASKSLQNLLLLLFLWFLFIFFIIKIASIFLSKLPKGNINKQHLQAFTLIFFIFLLTTLISSFTQSNRSTDSIQQAMPIPPLARTQQNNKIVFKLKDVISHYPKQVQQLETIKKARVQLKGFNLLAEKRPNIIFIHLESLRSDIFQSEIMPNLHDFSVNHHGKLANHFSTANNTGASVSGLLNGLSGSYYQDIKYTTGSPSLPVHVLNQLGYESKLFRSSPLDYEDTEKLLFSTFSEKDLYIDSGTYPDREQKMVDSYLKEMSSRSNDSHHFDYLLFYGTHYPYHYPEPYAKNKPDLHPDELFGDSFFKGGIRDDMKAGKESLFNRYKNSARYIDNLLKQVLSNLQDNNKLENTIIFIAGDHGEEFWEKGQFGHTYNLVNEQTKTLAYLHLPQNKKTQYKVTSHQDIFPTIFDFMEINYPIEKYMTGKSLLDYQQNLDFTEVTFGVIGSFRRYTEILINPELKVKIKSKGEVEVLKIMDLEDTPISNFEESLVKNLIRNSFENKEKLTK